MDKKIFVCLVAAVELERAKDDKSSISYTNKKSQSSDTCKTKSPEREEREVEVCATLMIAMMTIKIGEQNLSRNNLILSPSLFHSYFIVTNASHTNFLPMHCLLCDVVNCQSVKYVFPSINLALQMPERKR